MEEQARRALENLKAILEESGASLKDVVKVTFFLGEGAGFDEFKADSNLLVLYPKSCSIYNYLQAGILRLKS